MFACSTHGTLFCRDRRFDGTLEEFQQALKESTTVYVGNVSFYTTEDQIYEVFSKAGDVKRIIMGLDKNRMTPCGFCFVVYYTRKDTEDCVKYLNGTVLDDRPIRVDFDWGFVEGRQFGRGKSGGQVRDEYRMDFDPGRGGYGTAISQVAPDGGHRQQEQHQRQSNHRHGYTAQDAPVDGHGQVHNEKRFRRDDSDNDDDE